MLDPAATTPPMTWWEIARLWGGPAALAAVLGWVGRQYVAWRKRRALDVELREAVLEATRRTADACRWSLIQRYGKPGDLGFLSGRDEHRRAAVLLDDVENARARLWTALGMPDPEDETVVQLTSDEKQVLLRLKQTMRFKVGAMKPEKRRSLLLKQEETLVEATLVEGDHHE